MQNSAANMPAAAVDGEYSYIFQFLGLSTIFSFVLGLALCACFGVTVEGSRVYYMSLYCFSSFLYLDASSWYILFSYYLAHDKGKKKKEKFRGKKSAIHSDMIM